jgi:drug/metabolite transporter (DMT)-like permease
VNGLVLGLVFALAAATFYGSGPLLQALAARQTAEGSGLGLGLLARLARNKLWLAGVAADFGGFGFEALALALAPAAFVTPLLLFDMVVLALLATRVVHERMTRIGLVGVGVILLGGALLTLAFGTSHHSVGREAHLREQLVLAGVVAATALAAYVAGRMRTSGSTTAIMAGAAGISYAAATLCTRQIGLSLKHHSIWHQLATPAPYILLVAALLSLSLLSRALQHGAAVVAIPVCSAFAALLPAAAGLALFKEPVPSGGGLVSFIAALPLLVLGLVLLARQPNVTDVLAAEAGHAATAPTTPAPSGAVPAMAEPAEAGLTCRDEVAAVSSLRTEPGAGPR